eukprot:CAMPEP_0170184502 /NCGR_PEP_ID=MMETSP0040_2-20121228/33816_1 /TAXON_ID=641309 /ORGANISM="Lotharella oceanica, Strain CCMP622" /LENGTH=40 /DNA_ID= /DNA_START= /DNA_END= /DNA_ORIENTATION=
MTSFDVFQLQSFVVYGAHSCPLARFDLNLSTGESFLYPLD